MELPRCFGNRAGSFHHAPRTNATAPHWLAIPARILRLSNVFDITCHAVVMRRHHAGKSFVVMEKAIAILVEAFANDSTEHDYVAFTDEIGPRCIPERLDRGLPVGIESDRLGSWSSRADAIELHVPRSARIGRGGPVDLEKG